MILKKLIIVLIIFLIPSIGLCISVIPGVDCYGCDATFGRFSQSVVKVTSLADDGGGALTTFREAVATANSGNYVIVFEVGGTINLATTVIISGDNITIAGQTAPYPGIEFMTDTEEDPLLYITGSGVLMQHISIRPGDGVCDGNNTQGNLDALSIEDTAGAVSNVILDHVTMLWAGDETMSVWNSDNTITNISIIDSIMMATLQGSCHNDGGGYENHPFGPLFTGPAAVGTVPTNILLLRNIFGLGEDRWPKLITNQTILANNIVYGYTSRGMYFEGKDGLDGVTQLYSVVSNIFIQETYTPEVTRPIRHATISNGTGDDQFDNGSEIYLDDNDCTDWDGGCTVTEGGGGDPIDNGVSDPVTWPTSLSGYILPQAEVRAYVLANAGSRPIERDTINTDIITLVTNETGVLVDCVDCDVTEDCTANERPYKCCTGNGTGTCVAAYETRPVETPTERELTVPANPNDNSGNGYSNLEVWLQGYSDAVVPSDQAEPTIIKKIMNYFRRLRG